MPIPANRYHHYNVRFHVFHRTWDGLDALESRNMPFSSNKYFWEAAIDISICWVHESRTSPRRSRLQSARDQWQAQYSNNIICMCIIQPRHWGSADWASSKQPLRSVDVVTKLFSRAQKNTFVFSIISALSGTLILLLCRYLLWIANKIALASQRQQQQQQLEQQQQLTWDAGDWENKWGFIIMLLLSVSCWVSVLLPLLLLLLLQGNHPTTTNTTFESHRRGKQSPVASRILSSFESYLVDLRGWLLVVVVVVMAFHIWFLNSHTQCHTIAIRILSVCLSVWQQQQRGYSPMIFHTGNSLQGVRTVCTYNIILLSK